MFQTFTWRLGRRGKHNLVFVSRGKAAKVSLCRFRGVPSCGPWNVLPPWFVCRGAHHGGGGGHKKKEKNKLLRSHYINKNEVDIQSIHNELRLPLESHTGTLHVPAIPTVTLTRWIQFLVLNQNHSQFLVCLERWNVSSSIKKEPAYTWSPMEFSNTIRFELAPVRPPDLWTRASNWSLVAMATINLFFPLQDLGSNDFFFQEKMDWTRHCKNTSESSISWSLTDLPARNGTSLQSEI